MDRAAKLRKLIHTKHKVPHLSQSAFAELVEEFRKEGLPDLAGRKHQEEALSLELQRKTRHGPLLRSLLCISKDGKPVRIPAADPMSLLDVAFSKGGAHESMLHAAWQESPCTHEKPWGLILYADEITPGNVLSHDNLRRVWAFYFALKQFGAVNLQAEGTWLCPLIVRSSVVSTLECGISQVAAALLRAIFARPEADVREQGLLFRDSSGEPFRLHLELAFLLQDGGAHKHIFGLKGDAGTRFCVLCKNLLAKQAYTLTETDEHVFTCDMMSESEVFMATNEELAESISRMKSKARELSAADFARWQQAAGFNYQPLGLLFDEDLQGLLRPATQFMHDWAHCLVVHGVFQSVTWWLLEGAYAAGVDLPGALHLYMREWVLPQAYKRDIVALWSPKRAKAYKAAAAFKCTASEALAAYPLLALFLEQAPLPHILQPMAKVFLPLADLLDIIQAIPLHTIQPTALRASVESFYQAIRGAGWAAKSHSKFHWLIHFAKHLEKHKMLPGCLVQERKHRLVKRFAADIQNTRQYENSLLKQVLAHDIADFEDSSWVSPGRPVLLKPRPPTKKEAAALKTFLQLQPLGCTVSTTANLRPAVVARGDYAALKAERPVRVVQLWLFLDVAGDQFALVSPCARLDVQSSMSCAFWQNQNEGMLLPLPAIGQPLTWRRNEGQVQTILPLMARE